MSTLELTGDRLRLEDIERVARGGAAVALADTAVPAMEASRAVVEAAVREGRVVYGLTTGFGALAEVIVPPDRITELQENLIRSHAAGVGEPLPEHEVRAIMLLRANVLALGYSGIRVHVVQRILDLLNHRIHPVVPARGSVGASGDLAPLSHIALALMGEGWVTVAGSRKPAESALRDAGLEPVTLAAKEGLALNNGTQAMTGVGALALLAAERAVETAEVAGAMSLEALRGTPDPFDEAIQRARPQPGQSESAARLRTLLAESEIRESHREDDPRVQDAYSLRCMPQVHGAARQAFRYARQVLEVEANSATDNPLIFADEGRIVSGGNFHGQPVARLHFRAEGVYLQAAVGRQAGARRDEVPHDDVFLEAGQAVDLAEGGGFGEHAGGLLEGGRGDEGARLQARLGDAQQHRLAGGGTFALLLQTLVGLQELDLVHVLAGQIAGIARVQDLHLLQHLAHDHFDVLVVDRHALEPVDLLDLVDQVVGQRLDAENAQDVVRRRVAVEQILAALDDVAFLHGEVLALGHQVFHRLRILSFRRDGDAALVLVVAPELDPARGLGDHGVVFGTARFEQLGHARQTTGDVAGLSAFGGHAGELAAVGPLGVAISESVEAIFEVRIRACQADRGGCMPDRDITSCGVIAAP